MADLIMIKRLGSLRPADAASEEAMNSLPPGQPIKVKVSLPRNLNHHRKLFALLQVVHENQSRYPTVEALLASIKIALGHYDSIQLLSGEIVPRERSISFAKMDQVEFNAFYNAVVDLVLQLLMPGTDRKDLERQVYQLIGIAI